MYYEPYESEGAQDDDTHADVIEVIGALAALVAVIMLLWFALQ